MAAQPRSILKFPIRRLTRIVFAFVVGLSLPAQSEALTPAQPQVSHFADADWYFYLSAGLARPGYDDAIASRIASQKDMGGSSPFAGLFDLPAIYRKLSPSFGAGGVLNASFETVARNWRDNDSFSVQTYNPAASVLYFPGRDWGAGFFARGDLGASHIVQIRQRLAGPELRFEKANATGIFAQGAIGYSWSASQKTRLLIHVNAFIADAGDYRMSGIAGFMGFLL